MSALPSHNPRTALVTGASRGLGAELVRQLAQNGFHCIATARTIGALEALDDDVRKAGGLPLTIVPLDLSKDHDALDGLGAELQQRYGKLDVFIGNAATLGALSPVGHTDPKKFDYVMAVNVTSNYRLLRSLDPLLRQSHTGQAIFMTCSQGSKAEAFWGSYAASKAALERLVECYAHEIRNTAMQVNLIDPGSMPTKLRADAFPGLKQDDHGAISAAAAKIIATICGGHVSTAKAVG
jgi:NAD(P)-dependent dehydrogenase (short-subunit alcohol dehydrogenase family)